jgi:hypothetical protein
MKLYHFTAREHLPAIQAQGLSIGAVKIGIGTAQILNAVWLTSDPNPDGHGLSDGGPIPQEEREAYRKVIGIEPDEVLPNTRAARITVRILLTDRKLKRWSTWSNRKVEPHWRDALNKTGGGKDATWFLYFGVIPPERFDAIDLMP